MYNMKKLFAILFSFLFVSVNSCFAFSELYYLKNTQTGIIQPLVNSNMSSYGYTIKNQSPIYGISQKNNSDYAVIILQQSGQNMFYYYQSNNNKKLNKAILKAVNNKGITYERSYNTNIISIYDNLAQKAFSQQQTNYVFDEYNSQNYQTSQTNKSQVDNSVSFKGYVAQIAKGTVLPIYLQNSINTATTVVGDRVIGVITSDIQYNGHVVFPQGSIVYGTLKTARHASYGSRNGRVVIDFNQIVTPENKTYNISTEEIDFTVTNDGKVSSVVKKAATGAVVGALAGLLYGAFSKDIGSAVAIGAGVGAGAGLATGAAEKGIDAEIPSFTEMELTLTKPVSVNVSY